MTILEEFEKDLDNLISQQQDPFFLDYMIKMSDKFSDEERIEVRGYFKGLKVAKEALERAKARAE